MDPLRPSAALALFVLAHGCTHASECAVGRACGAARWTTEATSLDAPLVVVEATNAAAPGLAPSRTRGDALPVSERAVFVHFELAPLRGARSIERAVLTLAPHPAWRTTDTSTLLTVRTIDAPWTPDSVAAGEAPPVGEHAAVFALPAGVRVPVRVDVSALLAGWIDGTTAPMGLMLATDHGEAVFRGVGSEDRHAAPHLEVVVR